MEATCTGVPRTVSAPAVTQSKRLATTINRSRIVFKFTGGCGPEKRSKLHVYSMTANNGTDVACNALHPPHLLQDVRVNVSAADDCYIHGGFWQLVFAEQKSRYRDSAAGLGDSLGIRRQPPHGLPYFVFADGHNVVYISANVFEIDRSNALRPQSIGDGPRDRLGSRFDNPSRAQACLRVRRELRLNSNDLCGWLVELDCRRHPAEHPSPADGHQYGFNFR